jgi:hypothetical protein
MKLHRLLAMTTVSLPMLSQGLFWTEGNKDRLCFGLENLSCSEVHIDQIPAKMAGTQMHMLSVQAFLYVHGDTAQEIYARNDAAKKAQCKVVVESVDHVKHDYPRTLEIKTERTYSTNGSSSATRYVEFEIYMPLPAIEVLGIDIDELDQGGGSVSRHEFRYDPKTVTESRVPISTPKRPSPAEPPKDSTLGFLNGRYWNSSETAVKVEFLVAYGEAFKLWASLNPKDDQMKPWFPVTTSFGLIMDSLNHFFEKLENLTIPVTEAIRLCNLKILGATDDQFNAAVAQTREAIAREVK